MVRRRKIKYVNGAGRTHTLDAIKIDVSSGVDDQVIDEYLDASEDDKIIRSKAPDIRRYLEQTEKMNSLERYYELGRMLQFIDEISTNDEDRKQTLKRLFHDLKIRKTLAKDRLDRYPERAYMLAKLPKELVFLPGLTWSHWFDILEYPHIFQNRVVLENIARRCSDERWASGKTGRLRGEIQKVNSSLNSAPS
jgi:predicted metalloendopeptidase